MRLPQISGKELIKILKRFGFVFARQNNMNNIAFVKSINNRKMREAKVSV